MSQTVRIAGVQMDVAFANPEANLRRMETALAEAREAGAHLAVFPECALTGYCFESLEECRPFAETVPGPATQRIAAAIRSPTRAIFHEKALASRFADQRPRRARIAVPSCLHNQYCT